MASARRRPGVGVAARRPALRVCAVYRAPLSFDSPTSDSIRHSSSGRCPVTGPDSARAGLPICIAGMHRSGTSLFARLLNLGGVYLGRDDELLAGGPSNPDGHWEHEGLMQVNEELLAECGGGWDCPP